MNRGRTNQDGSATCQGEHKDQIDESVAVSVNTRSWSEHIDIDWREGCSRMTTSQGHGMAVLWFSWTTEQSLCSHHFVHWTNSSHAFIIPVSIEHIPYHIKEGSSLELLSAKMGKERTAIEYYEARSLKMMVMTQSSRFLGSHVLQRFYAFLFLWCHSNELHHHYVLLEELEEIHMTIHLSLAAMIGLLHTNAHDQLKRHFTWMLFWTKGRIIHTI